MAAPLSRPARLWRWAGLGGAVLLVAAALVGWWLLGSAGGRELALHQALAALPEGALRVGEREGSLAGGLRLRDVVYEDEAARVEIGVLEATPRLPGLGEPAVNLAALRLRGLRVWPKDAPDEPTPPWPEGLPRLDLPITLRIDAVEVRDVVVHAAADATPPIVIDRVAGALDVQPGRLALASLELDAPEGRVRGALHYAPKEAFATRLALDGELVAGARLALRVDGTLAAGRATLQGEAGGPLALALDWKDADRLDTLAWALGVDATALDPATLGLTPAPAWDASLQVRGGREDGAALAGAPGIAMAVQGRIAQDGVEVGLKDSRLRLHEGVLHAEPLSLALFEGQVDLTGSYGIEDGAMALAASAKALAWGEGEARVQADGTATLRGGIEAWAADLDLGLQRGAQKATLIARVRGDADAIVLAPFTLASPGGRLEGEARYALDASAGFALEATLRGLDPAWLAPAWPGRIDAELRLEGAAPADAPRRVLATLSPLSGTLRGQRVDGELRVVAEGEALALQSALALGEGRLDIDGQLSPAWDLDLTVRTLDVAPWIVGARGVLDGRLGLTGSAERPAIDADLALLDAGWNGLQAQRLTARGTLPARGDGRLDLRAERLSDGEVRIEAIELALAGRVEAAGFELVARDIDAPNLPAAERSAGGHVEARGAWRGNDGFARGELTLSAFEATWPALPGVRLQAPATVAWRGADWDLPAPACLRVGAGGRLCAEGEARDARLAGDDLDLAWLAPFLPNDVDTPLAPVGLVALRGTHRWVDGQFRSTLSVQAPEGRLRVGGAAPETVFGWNDLVLEATHGEGWQVDLRADLLPDGRLEAGIAADAAGALRGALVVRATDLSVLEVLSADLVAPRGVVAGRLDLAGTLQAPRWQGAVAASPFAVELPALGIAVVDGDLRVEGGEDGQLRLRGRLPTGDGALELAGQWSEDERPNRVAIRGTDVRVLDTPDGRVWISPALDLESADGVARLRGRVDVPRAELALDRFEQGVAASADVVVIDDPPVDAGTGPQLDADLILALGDDVRLRGFGFDGRLAGELKLRDRVDRAPRALGTLELTGEVRAYGQQLDLERGTLRWGNAAIDEPTIDIRAVRPESEPEVGVAVTGSGLSPVVDVWSRPALPQAEALSWLMFGRPLAAADGDDAARLEEAATSLGGSAVAQAVAGKVGLDTASVGESRALGGTALTVGKRITPKLYVSYGMALSGTGQVITVTYALRRWLAAQVEAGVEQRIELEAKFERD